jgi:hypothetical protein
MRWIFMRSKEVLLERGLMRKQKEAYYLGGGT